RNVAGMAGAPGAARRSLGAHGAKLHAPRREPRDAGGGGKYETAFRIWDGARSPRADPTPAAVARDSPLEIAPLGREGAPTDPPRRACVVRHDPSRGAPASLRQLGLARRRCGDPARLEHAAG